MADVKYNAPKRVVLPNGGDEHDWDCWEIVKPIFNHNRSESNRVYSMVFNIIKASALLNYKHRDRTTLRNDGETHVAILVDSEDVANVIRCLETLRATTHEIDRKKRAIVEGIRAKSGPDDAIERVEPIREFLKGSDAPEINQGELKHILENLTDNYLISIDSDLYTTNNGDALGHQPLLEWWKTRRQELAPTGNDLLDGSYICPESAEIDVPTAIVGANVPESTPIGRSQTLPHRERTSTTRA